MAGAADRTSSPADAPASAEPRSFVFAGQQKGTLAFRECLINYLPTLLVIGFGIAFYTTLSRYFMRLYKISWTPEFGGHAASLTIDMATALQFFALLYAVLLIPYYLARPGKPSSAAVAAAYVWRRARKVGLSQPTEAEKQGMLCLLLKFIFIPFCIHGMLVYCTYLNGQVTQFANLYQSGAWPDAFSFYNTHLHFFILNLIFLADFVPFVIGYLIQAKILDNEIVSVDARLSGWAVCLVCYPPFNAAVVELLPFQVFDQVPAYPALSATSHLALNGLLLLFFAMYASASLSLGFKCSNLTNRGIVSSGLYGRMRHPAYFFKNLAWWLGAMPYFLTLLKTSPMTGLWAMACLAGWSGIYVLRALNEERHLLEGDNGYRAYAEKVRYRFIPGVL